MVTRGSSGRAILSLWALLLLAVAASAPAAERIVSLAPSLTEMVLDLQAGQLLVGRLQGGPQSVQLEQVPEVGMAGQLDLELLVQLQPDLVLYWPGSIGIQQLHKLEQLQIPVFHARAQTMQELASQYEQLGELLGLAERGREQAADIRLRLQRLQQRHTDQPRIRVFYQLWDRPLFTLGGPQILTDALRYCGADNIFADLDTPAPQVSMENVLVRKPQLVLLGSARLGESWLRTADIPQLVIENKGLERPSRQMVSALEQLCQAIDDFRSN